MAYFEFLQNLRQARSLYLHAKVDPASGLDPKQTARAVRGYPLWLARRSTRGFDANDFPRQSDDWRRDMTTSVGEFEAVASQVSPANSPTDEQYQAARAAFEKILALCDPYFPRAKEIDDVEAALASIEYPEPIVNWDCELRPDWTDAPAAFVTLYLDVADIRPFPTAELWLVVTRKIRNEFDARGIRRWPCPDVRRIADHLAQ